jgi:hypothetical protein
VSAVAPSAPAAACCAALAPQVSPLTTAAGAAAGAGHAGSRHLYTALSVGLPPAAGKGQQTRHRGS